MLRQEDCWEFETSLDCIVLSGQPELPCRTLSLKEKEKVAGGAEREPLRTVGTRTQTTIADPALLPPLLPHHLPVSLESTPFPKSYKEALCFADVLRGGITVIIIP